MFWLSWWFFFKEKHLRLTKKKTMCNLWGKTLYNHIVLSFCSSPQSFKSSLLFCTTSEIRSLLPSRLYQESTGFVFCFIIFFYLPSFTMNIAYLLFNYVFYPSEGLSKHYLAQPSPPLQSVMHIFSPSS